MRLSSSISSLYFLKFFQCRKVIICVHFNDSMLVTLQACWHTQPQRKREQFKSAALRCCVRTQSRTYDYHYVQCSTGTGLCCTCVSIALRENIQCNIIISCAASNILFIVGWYYHSPSLLQRVYMLLQGK
jgi:hypothetical protein